MINAQTLIDLLHEAQNRAPGVEREEFVAHSCGSDTELKAQLVSLLESQNAAGRFLQNPIVAPKVLDTQEPGDVIGRYKILEKLGEGGCGVVYVAEQVEPIRRRVALKVIKVGMDTKQVVARFDAERQALAMMDHANIAKVLDAGSTDTGRPYFVMELVRGLRITHFCEQNRFSVKERLDLFIKVCQGIQHAHQKGVIHRDIKPSNILVTLHDGVPVPKVIDFGIAKAIEGRLTEGTVYTQFLHFVGTPAYMSPEQAEMSGLDVDTRSDIYSLGVLLYELLTGQTPFDGEKLIASGMDEMRKTIREKEPTRPSQTLQAANRHKAADSEARDTVGTAIDSDLDWIVMKCLEKDRTRRYETANGLAADINRFLKQEPVIARAPTVMYRFRKMVNRNKLAFTALNVVAFALIAGLSFSTWAFIRERKARAGEAEQRRTAVEQRTKAERSEEAEKQERLRADAERNIAERHLYVARMHLVQQAWEQNNIGRVRQLLDETQAYPDRGFEWYYWQRQSHLALQTLRGHLGPVTSLAFSPDGQRIATGSEDQTAKIWVTSSGQELRTLKGDNTGIRAVAFSPDGQRIVTGSGDPKGRVWDAGTGQELFTLNGHSTGISSVAFSSNGQRIITGSWDQTAKVWEAATGRELHTLKGHNGLIWAVAFSPDGERIVTGSRDRTAKIWEAATGRELRTLPGHGAEIWSVAFSADGQQIATGSGDKTAKLWEAITGRELTTLNGHTAPIKSLAFSPDGQRIVTGSRDQTARLWETTTGRELLALKGHSADIMAVAFSYDGKQIATGSADQTVKLWASGSDREQLTLRGHSALVRSAGFSPDGERIVTGSEDQTARVWKAASGRELFKLEGHNAPIRSAAFSPDGQLIVTGSRDHTARVWDAADGHELLTLKGHSAQIWSVAVSPDGRRVVTGSGDRTAKVWDAATGHELLTLKGHSAQICSVAFSPEGQRIATGSGDHTAKLWDAVNGLELRTLTGHTAQICSVAFSPDGQWLVTGSWDGSAKVWETASGGEVRTLKGDGSQVWSAVFSPDGRRILTGSWGQTAKIWDVASGQELLTLNGHSGGIRSVAFSRDGQRILTGSEDQTAKVWGVARPEQVAAWEAEVRTSEQSLSAVRRERSSDQERQRIARSRDESAIKRWLILAPIALDTNQSGADGLKTEQIEGEGAIRPNAGEAIMTSSGELKWQEVIQQDDAIDFHMILGYEASWSVAYLVCYLRSETEQQGVRMLVGSDDQSKVYLNGKQIHNFLFPREFVPDQDVVREITLNAGLNVIVFKVVNEIAGWQGSIRFTDVNGNPLKEVSVTAGSPVKEQSAVAKP